MSSRSSRSKGRAVVRRTAAKPARPPSRIRLLPAGGVVAAIAVVALVVFASFTAANAPSAIHDITVADLRTELQHKDFTLLNVKTPYIGEIEGTDLYIPYDELAARASELPADKSAKIVVYCRTGNESSIASKALASLGYSHIENLTGGMTAWTAAGGTLVQKAR